MRIVDLLHKQGMNLNIKPTSKEQCINELVDLMDKTGNLNNKEEPPYNNTKRINPNIPVLVPTKKTK